MSAVLKDAALVIGVVAITVASAGTLTAPAAGVAATGFGATLAGAAGTLGFSSVAALSTGLAVAAAGLTALSALTAKKPANVVNPMAWQSDPQTGIPIVAGRCYTGGKIVYRQAYGSNNVNQTIISCYSIGPVKALENLYVDSVLTTVSGTTVNINDRGKMAASYQLGAQPEAKQLGDLGPPGLTAASKLSGLAASSISFVYDTKGGHTFTTEPQCGYVVQGVRVYDPRKDSTYPGGNGPQRWNDETTWTYAGYDNPYLFALAWLIGWHQNGKLVAGVGVSISAIILSQFVEGANVADANKWTMGGVLDTTDDKWSRLKDILQAGGGVPMRLDARGKELRPIDEADIRAQLEALKAKGVEALNDQALEALKLAYEARQSQWVIERGAKQVQSIKKAFQAASERSGVRATPYTLRHSAAVWMAEAGISMSQIAQFMGHDDSATTEKHYARFSPTFLKGAANALSLDD